MRMMLFTFSLFLITSVITFSHSCKKEDENGVGPDSGNPPAGTVIYESAKQKFWLDPVATDIGKPWGMAFLPGGDILFTELEGHLKRIEKGSGKVIEVTGLPPVENVGQGGLLDLRLHPDFAENGWIYFAYTKKVAPNLYTTAISRASLSGSKLSGLLQIFEAYPAFSTTHHFGCRMVFKDGFLYFSVGERGYMEQAQMLDRNNGKIMRIRDDGSIPSDNPFTAVNNAKPEIWSYGHRNPQGLVLNPVTGEIWEHEHGPKGGDELNVIMKGANYGWPVITYGINYDGSIITTDTAREGMEQPVTYWVPSIAPCGMIINNGNRYPNWEGNIFLGGLASRALFRIEVFGRTFKGQEKLIEGLGRFRNVALSPDGYIYIATEDPGNIYRIVAVN